MSNQALRICILHLEFPFLNPELVGSAIPRREIRGYDGEMGCPWNVATQDSS